MARPSYLLQLINTFGILCMHRYTKVITVSEREKNHYKNSRLFKLKTHEMKFKA